MDREELLELIANRADHITSALAATGKTIDFRDAELRPTTVGLEDCGGAFLDFAADKATVWSENGQALHQIFHVLLHLHRYWIEGIPQLWHKQNGCSGAVSSVEVAYEHLVVVPVEMAHYPEAFSYWVNYAEEKLYQCQEREALPASLKSQMFRLYLLAQTAFPRSQVADSISVEVWKQGLMDEFEQVADIVFKNYEHKAFVQESLCRYLGIVATTDLGLRRLENVPSADGNRFSWSSLADDQTRADGIGRAACGEEMPPLTGGGSAEGRLVGGLSRAALAGQAEMPADTILRDAPDLATALSRSPLTGQTAEEKAKILPRMGFGTR